MCTYIHVCGPDELGGYVRRSFRGVLGGIPQIKALRKLAGPMRGWEETCCYDMEPRPYAGRRAGREGNNTDGRVVRDGPPRRQRFGVLWRRRWLWRGAYVHVRNLADDDVQGSSGTAQVPATLPCRQDGRRMCVCVSRMLSFP